MSSSTSGSPSDAAGRPGVQAGRSAGSTGPMLNGQRVTDRPDRGQDRPGFLSSIKAPLIFSAVLGLIGGGVAMMTASGGTDNPLRVDIGLIAFGAFFIVSLVVVAMLQLASKENPEHLSQGSGVHRNSEELHRAMVAKRKEQGRAGGRSGSERTGPDSTTSPSRD